MKRFSYEQKNGKWQAKLLERHIVKEIIDRLWFQARIKVWIINQPVGGKTPQNVAGIPDLMGFVPWRTPMMPPSVPNYTRSALPLFIEVKRPGGVRRPAQERFIQEAREGGCLAFFAESWSDVVRELVGCGLQLKEID